MDMAHFKDGAQQGRRAEAEGSDQLPFCWNKRLQAMTVAWIQIVLHVIGLGCQIYLMRGILYPMIKALWTELTQIEAITTLMPPSVIKGWSLRIDLAFVVVWVASIWGSYCQIYASARLIKATMREVAPSDALENVHRWQDITIVFVVNDFLSLLVVGLLTASDYMYVEASLYFLLNLTFFFVVERFEKDLENRATTNTHRISATADQPPPLYCNV